MTDWQHRFGFGVSDVPVLPHLGKQQRSARPLLQERTAPKIGRLVRNGSLPSVSRCHAYDRSAQVSLLVRQRPYGRAYCLGKVRDDCSVDAVGLGETAGSAGEVADLAWIDHDQRQTGSGKLRRYHLLEAASRFKHNQLWDGCAEARGNAYGNRLARRCSDWLSDGSWFRRRIIGAVIGSSRPTRANIELTPTFKCLISYSDAISERPRRHARRRQAQSHQTWPR